MKLQTPVETGKSGIGISYNDKIMILGSCFADNVGKKMLNLGFDVCVNPFGTLYNPVSVCRSLDRIISSTEFQPEDCVQMGSGSPLICSFSHHTSFARENAEDFIDNANRRLSEASAFFRECNKVIITLGTSWCFRHIGRNEIVSNCLKRDAKEFARERLSPEKTVIELSSAISRARDISDKKFILTVSPIRHLKDGAHGNQVSKAGLLIATEELCSAFPGICEYFPSYEIMMDELRDYRFYAEDMVHPTGQAVEYIWERFCDFALPDNERAVMAAKEKEFRRSQHREMLHSR